MIPMLSCVDIYKKWTHQRRNAKYYLAFVFATIQHKVNIDRSLFKSAKFPVKWTWQYNVITSSTTYLVFRVLRFVLAYCVSRLIKQGAIYQTLSSPWLVCIYILKLVGRRICHTTKDVSHFLLIRPRPVSFWAIMKRVIRHLYRYIHDKINWASLSHV